MFPITGTQTKHILINMWCTHKYKIHVIIFRETELIKLKVSQNNIFILREEISHSSQQYFIIK